MHDIDRELAAHPQLVQIETAWSHPKEQRAEALQKHQYRELPEPENPDGEPPCESTRTAIVVFGKRSGQMLTACTDPECPIHDRQEAALRAAEPAPEMPPAPEVEADEEAKQRRAEHEQRRRSTRPSRSAKAEERRQQMERQEQEYQAEQAPREEVRQAREATYNCILENAPACFSTAQLRVLLRAIVNLDPYTFADDLAEKIGAEGDHDTEDRSAEEVLLSTVDATGDDKLTRFALRLALSGYRGLPREGEPDFLRPATSHMSVLGNLCFQRSSAPCSRQSALLS